MLGIFDGGYAREPWCGRVWRGEAAAAGRRIEILTRPRSDARLYKPLTPQPPGKGKAKSARWGRPRNGACVAAPKQHAKWNVPWVQGQAWAYGQPRSSAASRWTAAGRSACDVAVRVFVFEVEGYSKPWFIVTSALDLSAAQVLEAYAARFRQEDAIRDHKQRLGMQEVRAWTKAPVLRTFMVQQLCLTLLRLLQWEWDQRRGEGWCPAPPWNRHKTRIHLGPAAAALADETHSPTSYGRWMKCKKSIPSPRNAPRAATRPENS